MEHENIHPDASRQAMYQQFLKKSPQILCPSGHKVAQLCINPQCKNSLKCLEDQCKECGQKVHGQCLTISLDRVTKLINKNIEQWRERVVQLFVIEEEMIRKIRKNQEDFMRMFIEKQLQRAELRTVIKNVYGEKNYEGCSGGAIQRFLPRFKEEGLSKEKRLTDIQGYKSKMVIEIATKFLSQIQIINIRECCCLL